MLRLKPPLLLMKQQLLPDVPLKVLNVLLKKQHVLLPMRLAQLLKKLPSKLSLFRIEKCTGKAV